MHNFTIFFLSFLREISTGCPSSSQKKMSLTTSRESLLVYLKCISVLNRLCYILFLFFCFFCNLHYFLIYVINLFLKNCTLALLTLTLNKEKENFLSHSIYNNKKKDLWCLIAVDKKACRAIKPTDT